MAAVRGRTAPGPRAPAGTERTRYEIRSPTGELVAVHVRYDLASGGKTFAWFGPDGSRGLSGLRLGNLPLFGAERLRELKPGAQLIVCEGEKATLALQARGINAVGTVCGAGVIPSVETLQPLAPFDVVLWPDADPGGRKHMAGIGARLLELGTTVRVVDWADAPLKGDAADYTGDVGALLTAAKPFEPPVDGAKNNGRPEAVLIQLSTVKAEPIRWLWPERIALGKLTILSGDPGLGKSLLTLDLAARLSTGRGWPDGRPGGEAGATILLSAEDDAADTIRPRLEAAGADLTRVHLLEAVKRQDSETGEPRQHMFCLGEDLAALERAIERTPGVRLVIIDPLTAYLGRTDSHKNAEVRGLLAPLAALAAKHRVAVVAVSHLNKAAAGSAMYRTMGSLAFVAAARSVWIVAPDRQNPNRRLLLLVKNNLSADRTGLAYTLTEDARPGVPMVSWELGTVTLAVEDVIGVPIDSGERRDRTEAVDWLAELLSDGPLPAKRIYAEARAQGFSAMTIRRAAGDLRVRKTKGGMSEGWIWGLPGAEAPEGAQPGAPPRAPSKMLNLETEHLRRNSPKTGVGQAPEDAQAPEGAQSHLPGLSTFDGGCGPGHGPPPDGGGCQNKLNAAPGLFGQYPTPEPEGGGPKAGPDDAGGSQPLPPGNAAPGPDRADEGPPPRHGPALPGGWSVPAWIERLERLAAACEANQPQRAAALRGEAEALRRRLGLLPGGDGDSSKLLGGDGDGEKSVRC